MTDIRQLRNTPHPPPLPRTALTAQQQIRDSAVAYASRMLAGTVTDHANERAVLAAGNAVLALADRFEARIRDGLQVVTRDLGDVAAETAARDPEFRAGAVSAGWDPVEVAKGCGYALADLARDLEVVLNQQNLHSHTRPGIWDPDNRPALANTRCVECAARNRVTAFRRALSEELAK